MAAITDLLLYGTEGDDEFELLDLETATLIGLGGNDTYRLSEFSNYVIVEAAGGGIDTVRPIGFTAFTLPDNVENLLFPRTGMDPSYTGVGNALNNRIETGDTGDTLDGGGGRDTLVGFGGADSYFVDNPLDVIVESVQTFDTMDGSLHRDTVLARSNYTLPTNVEDIILDGENGGLNASATGNALGNVILGADGNNVLNGMGGDDLMDGLSGNDRLDGGTGNDGLFGNFGNDILIGGAGNDSMLGEAGNDNLSGGSGNDTMLGSNGTDIHAGGAGNDFYDFTDDTDWNDLVVEAAGQGTDTVQTARVVYTLPANVEILISSAGESAILTGNAGNNFIYGSPFHDAILGGAGNDFLSPGEDFSLDTMSGGTGNDTYNVLTPEDTVVELPGQGTDTVLSQTDYVLPDNVENLTLLVFTFALNGWGNALNNVLTGGIRLEGLAGNDTLEAGGTFNVLIGGAGNDLYRLNSAFDEIVELSNEGADTAVLTVNSGGLLRAMAPNLENLQIIAPSGWEVFGNESANRITGTPGLDQFDGGAGNDTLIGGAGDDKYFVDAAGDVVIEAVNQGNDRIVASVPIAMLAANVEELVLQGAALNGTGNALANTIEGNSLANSINGGAGNDELLGMSGDDTIDGGAGNDYIDGGSGNDLMIGGTGNDTFFVVGFDGIGETKTDGIDTVLTTFYATNLDTWFNVENLTLVEGSMATNGTGNAANNVITGNSRANTLTGGAGNDVLDGMGGIDTLIGGAGHDTYRIGSNSEQVTEGLDEGTDSITHEQMTSDYPIPANVENLTILSWEGGNVTGNNLNNIVLDKTNQNIQMSGLDGADLLVGGGGNNVLFGGPGADTLMGGAGNDVYNLNVGDAGDVVVEGANQGIDRVDRMGDGSVDVTYTLPANVENSVIGNMGDRLGTLFGNALDNTLTANGEGGAFLIDGRAGNDIVTSGDGNDTLRGGTGNDVLNAFVGNDSLDGGAGNDNLQGSFGNDIMLGGLGNDTYNVDSGDGAGIVTTGTAEDQVIELAGQGTDKVVTETSAYVLPANVENVQVMIPAIQGTLPGPYIYSVTGNAASNVFDLDGRALVTATGAGGNDLFRVNAGLTVGMTPTTPSLLLFGGDGADRAEITLNSNLLLSSGSVETIELMVNEISLLTGGEGIFDASSITIRGDSNLTLPTTAATTSDGPVYTFEDYAGAATFNVTNTGPDDGIDLSLIRSTIDLAVNVEFIRLNVVGGLGPVSDIDVSSVTNLDFLTVSGNGSLFINDLTSTIGTLDLQNYSGDVLTLDQSNSAGSQTVAMRLIGSSVTMLDMAGLGTEADTLILNSTAGSDARLRFSGDDAIDQINITGSGSLALELDDGDPGGASVQASAFDGTLRATIGPNATFTVTDAINGRYDLSGSIFSNEFNLGRALDSLDRINGGNTGGDTDVLSANVSGLNFATGALRITNVETINLSVTAGEDAQLNMQNVFVANLVNLTGGNGATFLEVVNAQGTWNAGTFAGELSIESFANFDATGGSLDDSLRVLGTDFGGATLNGRGGNDTLAGGNGADTFRFDTALGTTGVDTIEDFDVDIGDVLQLENAVFTALAAGVAPSFQAVAGPVSDTTAFNLKYNTTNGELFYDANGATAGGLTQFAVVQFGDVFPLLTAADFVVT